MRFNIIACINYNKAIGWKKTNDLIFNIPGDLSRFKKITTKSYNDKMNIVLMGRNTWDSLPNTKVLPDRFNCVISRSFELLNEKYKHYPNFKAFNNVDCFLNFTKNNDKFFNETYVIGGKSIYETFFKKNIIDSLYLTEIETVNYLGDIMFPTRYLCGFYLKSCEWYEDVTVVNKLDNIRTNINYSFRHYENYKNTII